mmetsp:Transcript_3590/g.5306  ORF Transcript_3590/g.5306 Transcript_3590/m.5306 type:complete len:108 (-) Transcript_3590:1359-1682(-)
MLRPELNLLVGQSCWSGNQHTAMNGLPSRKLFVKHPQFCENQKSKHKRNKLFHTNSNTLRHSAKTKASTNPHPELLKSSSVIFWSLSKSCLTGIPLNISNAGVLAIT